MGEVIDAPPKQEKTQEREEERGEAISFAMKCGL